MNLLILTPVYPPEVGGASETFKLWVKELHEDVRVANIIVLTQFIKNERLSERNENVLILRWLFPRSSNEERRFLRRLIEYLVIQFQLFLFLPLIIIIGRIRLIFLHATRFLRARQYINFPMCLLLNIFRKFGIRIISHATDQLLFDLGELSCFDKLICNSRNTYNLALQSYDEKKCLYIPNIFELPELDFSVTPKEVENLKPYILFGGGTITPTKGIYELLEAFKSLPLGYDYYNLVIIGENKEGKRFRARIEDHPRIHYLGSVSHKKMLLFINYAELIVRPSRSEGLPRICLESLRLGKKTILPPNIPEFEKYLPEHTLTDVEPNCIRDMIIYLLDNDPAISFPFEQHSPTKAVEILFSVIKPH